MLNYYYVYMYVQTCELEKFFEPNQTKPNIL
jgi:hypothetical protein